MGLDGESPHWGCGEWTPRINSVWSYTAPTGGPGISAYMDDLGQGLLGDQRTTRGLSSDELLTPSSPQVRWSNHVEPSSHRIYDPNLHLSMLTEDYKNPSSQ